METLNLNIPPPPTLIEVINILPKDFKPDYPPTDRLASALDAWDLSKQMVRGLQDQLDQCTAQNEMIKSDMQITINILLAARTHISDPKMTEVIDTWLNKFRNPSE